jgi:hypothetical protein
MPVIVTGPVTACLDPDQPGVPPRADRLLPAIVFNSSLEGSDRPALFGLPTAAVGQIELLASTPSGH